MLSAHTCSQILSLHATGESCAAIARIIGVSRTTVCKLLIASNASKAKPAKPKRTRTKSLVERQVSVSTSGLAFFESHESRFVTGGGARSIIEGRASHGAARSLCFAKGVLIFV
jgi:Winged helix-turn helix